MVPLPAYPLRSSPPDASGEAQYLALVELLLAFQPDTVSPTFSEPIVVPITKSEAPGGRTSLAWIRSNFRHPFHRQLKSRYPSIPAMRFSRPIATFYRSDLLLHQPATELPQILADSAISDIELAHPVNESLVGHELFFDRWKKGRGVWDLMRGQLQMSVRARGHLIDRARLRRCRRRISWRSRQRVVQGDFGCEKR